MLLICFMVVQLKPMDLRKQTQNEDLLLYNTSTMLSGTIFHIYFFTIKKLVVASELSHRWWSSPRMSKCSFLARSLDSPPKQTWSSYQEAVGSYSFLKVFSKLIRWCYTGAVIKLYFCWSLHERSGKNSKTGLIVFFKRLRWSLANEVRQLDPVENAVRV